MVTHVVDNFFRFLKFLLVVCLSTMVIMVFGNVILRYGFNSGITISEELSRWCFVWLTFIGGVTAMREHAHLGMEMVVTRLPVTGKKICYVLSNVVMLACVLFFLVGSWDQTVINLGVEAPATGLSQGLYYGTGIFFSVIAFFVLLGDLYAMWSGKLRDKDLVQVKESQDDLDEEELKELQEEMERALADPKKQGEKTP